MTRIRSSIAAILEDVTAPPTAPQNAEQLKAIRNACDPHIDMTVEQMSAIPDDCVEFTSPGDSDGAQDRLMDWIEEHFPDEHLDAFQKPSYRRPERDNSMQTLLAWVAQNAPERAAVANLWAKRCATGEIVGNWYFKLNQIERMEYDLKRQTMFRDLSFRSTDFSDDAVDDRLGLPSEDDMQSKANALEMAKRGLAELEKKMKPLLMVDTVETLMLKHSMAAHYEEVFNRLKPK